MKFRMLYKIFGLALLAFIFQSRSSGPFSTAGLQVSGAPNSIGSEGTCANSGCHSAGNFNPTLEIEFLNSSGMSVDKYMPGQDYTVRVNIAAGDGTPSNYGFQATARDESGNVSIGNFTAPSGTQIAGPPNVEYIEHALPGSSGTFEFTWTAPAAMSGDVTFYSAGIAGNGSGVGGDGTASSSLAIEEDETNSTNSIDRDYATMNIFTNPVSDQLILNITSRASGDFDLRIADMTGKIVQNEPILLSSGENQRTFDVSQLQSGFYAVQLCGETHVAAVQMLKL